MPYESLRDYLSVLESQGLLQWVEKEVDKNWEISSLARQYFRKTNSQNRTALGFRRVKGYDIPVVLGLIGASQRIYGLALETALTPEEFVQTWKRGFENPLPPSLVKSGPCKEIILTDQDVDLHRFPIPL
jgi:4-hydroxy-3-polyprenylbenzoate decarboxylase